MGRLDGRVAIVTGGANGIGAAYAKGLAAEGAAVVIADVKPAADVVGIIEQAGGRAMSVIADVTDEESCEGMVAAAVETYGKLDILVSNAGLYVDLERMDFTKIDAKVWARLMAVNITGVWQSAKSAAPEMRRNGYGKIINVSSSRAFKGGAGMLHYDTSKGAIIAMTRSLAREMGDDGVTVNCIAPGATETETQAASIGAGDFARRRPATIASRALKRAEEPDDLVGICVFLASRDSDFMTGQTIVVDGGGIMW